MLKKILLLIFVFIATYITAQEKGSIVIGVTNPNNELVSFENIKTQLSQQYAGSFKKIEYCTNHSLIHIVVDIQVKPNPTEQEIVSFLSTNFPNYVFHQKIINESLETLNCKWK